MPSSATPELPYEPEDIKVIAREVATILHEMRAEHGNATLVDVEALAKHLNVPASWVYEQTRNKGNGSIPRLKVGKYVRFNIHDVLEWLKRQ